MSLRSLIKAIDLITGSMKSIDSDHAYIHQALFYSYSEQNTIATGTSRFIAFTTPNGTYDIHYRPSIISASADKLTIKLYEGSVITGGSNVLTSVRNHNRKSTKTTNMQTLVTGTAHTTPGTLLLTDFIPGGTGVGQARSGASTGQENEWVLKHNTVYVLELANGSSEDNIVDVIMNWYEEDEYTNG